VITATTFRGSFQISSYDDPPNNEPDTEGTMTAAATLSEEYTTDQLKQRTFDQAWSFKGHWRIETPTAQLLLPVSEMGTILARVGNGGFRGYLLDEGRDDSGALQPGRLLPFTNHDARLAKMWKGDD